MPVKPAAVPSPVCAAPINGDTPPSVAPACVNPVPAAPTNGCAPAIVVPVLILIDLILIVLVVVLNQM